MYPFITWIGQAIHGTFNRTRFADPTLVAKAHHSQDGAKPDALLKDLRRVRRDALLTTENAACGRGKAGRLAYLGRSWCLRCSNSSMARM